MPLLKKAIIQLKPVFEKSVPAIYEMPKAVSHVEGLHLDIGGEFGNLSFIIFRLMLNY